MKTIKKEFIFVVWVLLKQVAQEITVIVSDAAYTVH
jgi:hypothetical protein